MAIDLEGRVAVITGASAGIGRASAEHLAAEGMAVVLAARRLDRLQDAVASIEGAGGRAFAVVTDVTREDDVQSLITQAVEAYGRLDVLVCNAGIGFHGSIGETEPAVMRQLIDVNFMGTYLAIRAAVPVMRRHGSGHLVVVSSIVGRRGIPFTSGYCASKAAQVGFAEALRVELAESGIRVSLVYPVSTRTEFHEAMRQSFGRAVEGKGPRQSAHDVARSVVGAIRGNRPDVYPHRLSRGLVILNTLSPHLCDLLVRRYSRRDRTGGQP